MIAQAHERAARQLADDPVRLTNALGRIAQLYSFIGDLETAEPLAAQAVALAEVNLGEQHPNTNVMRVDLALLHYRAGRPQQAADVLAKAIEATRLRTQDDVHARALHMHAITMKQLKRLDEALDSETRSFAWYREHLPSDTQTLVGSYLTLGNIQLLRDDNSAAEQAYLAALELSKQHGLRDRLLMARSDYANFLFQTGRAGQAVTELETLLAELAQDGGSAYDVAQYEFDLARALWRVGNRGRARAVATRVLQVLRTVEPTPQVNGHIRRDWTVEEVEQWFPDPDAWEDT